MDRETSDLRIANAAKTLFSYCRARTNSREEAEDLSQDILLELLRSRGNLRDDRAFYAFMWAVAGNVYKNWCKKHAKSTAPLDERLPDDSPPLTDLLENEADLALLRRELSLLTERHRRVTVLYYFDGLRVAEIAGRLGLSEAMVKFLLFKSRQILKEGMDMERTPGTLSFNPGRLRLHYWGTGGNPFWRLCEDSLIAQNILLACYNDSCTAEEISLQLGVAVPYLEKDLGKCCEVGVLSKKGGRYETSIVIFTKEFAAEAGPKMLPFQKGIAAIIEECLRERLGAVKAIGFYRGGEDDRLLKWHIAAILLEKAVLDKYQGSIELAYPTRFPGCEAFVTGDGDAGSRWFDGFGTSWSGNAAGDLIRFLDFMVNGEMDHCYFFNYPNRGNVILDIAGGKSDGFSENDREEIAGFIERGFVGKDGDTLRLRLPVFTQAQFERLLDLLDGVTDEIADKTRAMVGIVTEILVQYTPAALRKEAESVGVMKMFDAIAAPVQLLLDDGVLRKAAPGEHPTAYVVLG